jgi:hypothetical protein
MEAPFSRGNIMVGDQSPSSQPFPGIHPSFPWLALAVPSASRDRPSSVLLRRAWTMHGRPTELRCACARFFLGIWLNLVNLHRHRAAEINILRYQRASYVPPRRKASQGLQFPLRRARSPTAPFNAAQCVRVDPHTACCGRHDPSHCCGKAGQCAHDAKTMGGPSQPLVFRQ